MPLSAPHRMARSGLTTRKALLFRKAGLLTKRDTQLLTPAALSPACCSPSADTRRRALPSSWASSHRCCRAPRSAQNSGTWWTVPVPGWTGSSLWRSTSRPLEIPAIPLEGGSHRRQFANSAPAPGSVRCYAPGELEHETEDGTPSGIPLRAGNAGQSRRLRAFARHRVASKTPRFLLPRPAKHREIHNVMSSCSTIEVTNECFDGLGFPLALRVSQHGIRIDSSSKPRSGSGLICR